ncbi:hypothetical protein KP509_06G038500 [Ceratopteris richardii]|uniref:RRM domain-containing protein n=1 Tax=Ceratopteris richardii TaxID=49495 RepID=A0A8T2UNB7_CERRI|nr:hypothetical protein KP509_06G038500 [Ceratopteris richardii]
MATMDGLPVKEDARNSVQRPRAAPTESKLKSPFIREFARQVRVRAKRAGRHVRPQVYLRKPQASVSKVKDFEEPVAEDLCKSADEGCAKGISNETNIEKDGEMYNGVHGEEGADLECKSSRMWQALEDDGPSIANVITTEEKGGEISIEDGELDASQYVDCYAAIQEGVTNASFEQLKSSENELPTNSCGPAELDSTYKECSNVAVHESFAVKAPDKSFTKGFANDRCYDHDVTEGVASNSKPRLYKNRELTYSRRERRECSPYRRHSSRACSLSTAQEGGAMSDVKEHTVLETLLPDEPSGFNFDGGSDGASDHVSGRRPAGIRKPVLERIAKSSWKKADVFEGEDRGHSEGPELSGSESAHSQRGGRRRYQNGHFAKHFSPSTPGGGNQFTDQVPSVLCDAEGNVWHIGKRAEQAKFDEDARLPGPPKARFKERRSVQQSHEPPDYYVRDSPSASYLPYSHLIPLNWRWSERADINNESTNRMVVAKERSVFVGCIPDGVTDLEELLNNLMDTFLERFDFAPAVFGQIESVKCMTDFAFIELASDKVAQIVLAANQLDVYEWGVGGYHLNIQGCTSTCTSVRPSVEYLPLKPARVLFVGNIPKSSWHQELLEDFFSRMLQGSDGPCVPKYVVSVLLIPDSCDAYVEVASEIMADALIFKCTKNPEYLKEIGEDVFICRDVASIPLMSRHKGNIYPQRCLVVAVPPGGEELKINNVVKVFLDVLPFIAKKNNQAGYLEFVLIEPGKDYAFFQFNSEMFVDAIMDEYIESTQIFLCRGSPASYIILRPPQYVRPGATYRSGRIFKLPAPHTYGSEMARRRQAQKASQDPTVIYVPRRFGDEPVKRPDFILSLGSSPPPKAKWDGLTASGCCASDPECMIVVKGLPRGLSFKLARGALNELFERLLCDSGLLEAGKLTVTYLDRDGNLDVASLSDPDLVSAVLSYDSTFIVAGEEIRLFPYDRKGFHRGNSADLSGGPCEISSLSDEGSPGCMLMRNGNNEGMDHVFQQPRRWGHADFEGESLPKYSANLQGLPGKRSKNFNTPANEWDHEDGWNGPSTSKQCYRGFGNTQTWHGINGQHQAWDVPSRSGGQGVMQPDNLRCQGNNPRLRIHGQKMTGNLRTETGNGDAGTRFKDRRVTENGFRILSREGRRTVQQGGGPYVQESGGNSGMGNLSVIRKRKLPFAGPGHVTGFNNKMRRTAQFP